MVPSPSQFDDPRHPQGGGSVVFDRLVAGIEERQAWMRFPAGRAIIGRLQGPPMGSGAEEPVSFLGLICLPTPSLAHLEQALKAISAPIQTGGALLLAALGPGTLLAWRRARGLSPETEPRGLDLHDLGDLLSRTGFAAPVTEAERLVLSYRQFETAWKDLHGLWPRSSGPGLSGRSSLARGRAEFEDLRGADGRVSLEFELVFAHGWRGQARARAEPQADQPLTFQPRGRFG